MKFLFVNLSIDSGYHGVNHGVAYLVPIVRKNGFEVSSWHIMHDISGEEFKKRIEDLDPSIVGFSCTSLQLKYLIRYSKAIEGLANVLQIAGGVGPTLDPERVLTQTSVAGVVIGEGEMPLDSLLKAFSVRGDIYATKGFYWKTDGGIVKNPIPPFISDLSQLDLPDYGVFEKQVVLSGSSINLMLSRGCPYSCSYCCNKAIRDVYPSARGHFRIPSVEYSMKLLRMVLKGYPETKFINFEDDLLIANKEWFLSFAAEYRSQIGIPYRMCVRTECVTPDIVKAQKESGCHLAFLGIESGNEDVRKEILDRHHTNAQIIEKARLIKQAGIKLFTFNMVGLPFETKQQMADTLELNRRIRPDCGVCSFFYPLPGTTLYEKCKREGLINSHQMLELPANYNTRPVIKLAAGLEKEAIRTQKRLQGYFYWREFVYELRESCSGFSRPTIALNFVRLLAVYILRKCSAPYERGSLYRKIVDSRFRVWLWRKLFGKKPRGSGSAHH